MLAIQDTFLDAFSQLPKAEQKRAREMIKKIQDDSTSKSLNFEKYKEALDQRVHSIRVNDTYRAIVLRPDEGDTLLLLWIDHHDAAYRWAKRKRFHIHPQTGTIQMWTVQEQDREHAFMDVQTHTYSLYHNYSIRQLLDIGVPEEMVNLVKQITTIDVLESHRQDLPADAYEALLYLASGEEYEEVYQFIQELRLEELDPSTSLDWNKAIQSPINSRQIVVVTDDDQLSEILDKPLEKWRIFLHPNQKKLVDTDFHGPVRVLGGAGTGKTVVALHRARRLARKSSRAEGIILVTTFTNNLAEYLQSCLESMCHSEEMNRFEVISIDRLARSIVEQSPDLQLEKIIWNHSEIEEIWGQACEVYQISKDRKGFIQKELDQVIFMQGLESWEEYALASRTGRSRRISLEERKQIWEVVSYVQEELSKRKWYYSVNVLMMARKWIEKHPELKVYRSAVIDEAQDFHPEAFRLLRALVPQQKNDLFIAGDAHQRIYDRHVVLSRCGIDIRGRSKRLRVNYRTTEQIREHAMKRLEGFVYDDLDGGELVVSETSLIYGRIPERRHFFTEQEEIQYVIEAIRDLILQGVNSSEIAVLARRNQLVEQVMFRFIQYSIPTVLMTSRYTPDREGVHCGTMHRSKGLEFRVVFLVHVNEDIVPPQSWLQGKDLDQQREIEKTERSLLYVASTRARDLLYVTSYGKPSRLWDVEVPVSNKEGATI